jgi:hypothetical protein
MPKQSKTPFANIRKPADSQLAAAMCGHAFKRCISCGQTIVPSETLCYDCRRIKELGLRDRVYQPTGVTDQRADTQPKQSFPSDKRSGYHDTISNAHIPPTHERF